MSHLKAMIREPLEKYRSKYVSWMKFGALAVCASTWLYALVDQLYSSAHVMKYLLMSLIMIALALI